MGIGKKIKKKNSIGKGRIVFTVANLLACWKILCQRHISAVNVTCAHCFMFVFNDQISYSPSLIATKCRTSFPSSSHVASLFIWRRPDLATRLGHQQYGVTKTDNTSSLNTVKGHSGSWQSMVKLALQKELKL